MSPPTFSPRVVGTTRPDFYSIETILASPPFAGKHGEALVLALYNYFTNTTDGTYHFWAPDETEGEPRVRGTVIDPVILLNAYGWALCGQTANTLYNVYQSAGLPAHVFGAPGHTLCEVFFDNRWHILDVDMWTWFRTPEGHIASAAELARNPEALILKNPNKSNPCDLPDRRLEDYAAMYKNLSTTGDEVTEIFPPWNIRGHTMDFHLRPGETLIRSQGNAGRYHLPKSWMAYREKFSSEWKGSPRERYEPFRTFGNGRLIYTPSLSAKYRDFTLGVWEREGVSQDRNGLVGPGSAVFRMQSPYPFCGKPDWTGDRITCADGAWLDLAGEGTITAEIQDSEGKWIPVVSANGKWDGKTDITALLEARYAAPIRITLGKQTRLTRFGFDGYLQTAPLSLPRLVEGTNPMEVRGLDAHRLRTVPWTVIADFRASADPAAQCFAADNVEAKPHDAKGWIVLSPKDPAKPLVATYRYQPPAGRKFAWFYVNATVKEGLPKEPLRKAAIDISTNGVRWIPLTRINITNGRNQWDNSLAGEAKLPVPTDDLFIRVTSDTSVCAMSFYGHLDESNLDAGELEIAHRWKEDDGEKSFTAPKGQTSYAFPCGGNPREHTIEMRVGPVKQGASAVKRVP
ncbi:MAG: hypothetical protein V1809_07555 [Planctomycetota bacterium]